MGEQLDTAAILQRVEQITRSAREYRPGQSTYILIDPSRFDELVTICRTALADTRRVDELNKIIDSDGLYIDGNTLPPISLYPIGSEEEITGYDLREVADAAMAATPRETT